MNPQSAFEDHPRVSTEVFATRNHVKPETVIKRRCKTGTYHGVHARKLANNRLDWPDIVVVKGASPNSAGTRQSTTEQGSP